MSREILFRAWDLDQGQYVTEYDTGKYGSIEFLSDGRAIARYKELTCYCNPDHACGGCADVWVDAENIIVEQYTGLDDANGTKIFEGDIVDNGRVSFVVVWRDSGYWSADVIDDPANTPENTLLIHYGESWKVIGNIHEEA